MFSLQQLLSRLLLLSQVSQAAQGLSCHLFSRQKLLTQVSQATRKTSQPQNLKALAAALANEALAATAAAAAVAARALSQSRVALGVAVVVATSWNDVQMSLVLAATGNLHTAQL